MNPSHGWIKLYRCLLDDPIWQCSTNEQKVILVTLLLMANHAEAKWQWNGRPYHCQPGQMITSLDSIRKKCGKHISPYNIRTALKRFETFGFLTNQSTKTGRLITICNWECYQSVSESIDNQTHKHPTPNKNDLRMITNTACVIFYLRRKRRFNGRMKALKKRKPNSSDAPSRVTMRMRNKPTGGDESRRDSSMIAPGAAQRNPGLECRIQATLKGSNIQPRRGWNGWGDLLPRIPLRFIRGYPCSSPAGFSTNRRY
ncbi:MAG: hypothetical protein ABFR90_10080 [Planctomycetota bacterium]